MPAGTFDFSHHRTRHWQQYEVYLKRFRGHPSPLLELGSGIGLFLEACRRNGIDALGLELEDEGVRETIAAGLDARRHDLADPLPLADASFEAVFSNQVIEHVRPATQRMMIAESFRVLKPGGQLHIISPCRHYAPARQDTYHIALLTPSELRAMVEAAGFVDANMGYNRMQATDDPAAIAEWRTRRPDEMAQDACVLTWKPRI